MNTLGAGATIPKTVEQRKDADNQSRYVVSSDFYKTLLLMRAAAIPAFRTDYEALASHAAAKALRTDQPPAQGPARPLHADRQRALPNQQATPPIEQRFDASAEWQDAPDMQAPQPRRAAAPPPLPLPAAPQGEPFEPRMDAELPRDLPRVARSEPGNRPDQRPDQRTRQNDDLAAGLGSRIRAELIQLAALYPWNEREISMAVQLGENSEPEQSLRRLTGRAPHLAKLVGEAIDGSRQGIRGAYEQLRGHHGHDPVYLQVLETVAGELNHLLPVLFLSPDGPYQQILERIVYDLEPQAAEGTLSPVEKATFARSKQQIEALRALSDSRPDRLARVARIIDQYDERIPSHQAQADVDRRTLN